MRKKDPQVCQKEASHTQRGQKLNSGLYLTSASHVMYFVIHPQSVHKLHLPHCYICFLFKTYRNQAIISLLKYCVKKLIQMLSQLHQLGNQSKIGNGQSEFLPLLIACRRVQSCCSICSICSTEQASKRQRTWLLGKLSRNAW